MDLDKLLNIKFTWENRKAVLEVLDKPACVKFAIFCAEQALPNFEEKYPHDLRQRKAIETAKAWLEGKATEEECSTAAAYAAYAAAAAAAYAAAYTAYAAAAAAAATYAAAAADAAAADAAADAAAAAAAAYAAGAASNQESTKQDQMDYLRDLIIESLTDEQKENWLLVASL